MISLSPLSLISTINVSSNSKISYSSLYPFSQKHNQSSKHGKPKRQLITCSGNNSNQNNPKEEQELLNNIGGHRRNVLIGLGGIYSTLAINPSSLASPISPPDLSKCAPPDLPLGATPPNLNCCPPYSQKITDFRFPSRGPLRVRQAAHLVNDEYLAKYKKAIQLMKALPSSDPRNFTQQANIHCAYCDGAYSQVGFPDLDLQVHGSWLFFPFHRWYVYFYERILGSLIKDPTFALPFWNYDAPCGMEFPPIYTDTASPLYDKLRNASHQPPTVIDLNYGCVGDNGTDVDARELIYNNLTIMYRQVFSCGKTSKLFLGNPYRAGDVEPGGAGSIENVPHGTVHTWTGDNTQPNDEDMGTFYSAARDPIFYSHHSNIDRLWSIWKKIGGKRKDFKDKDWLESGFLFYDENKNLVRVNVKDCLDTKKLGYVYQDVPIPWLKAKPAPGRKKVQKKVEVTLEINDENLGESSTNFQVRQQSSREYVKFPLVLDDVMSAIVKRPQKSRSKEEKEKEEEILLIDGIEFENNIAIKFDVLINDEDKVIGPGNTEFAGSFVNVPHSHKHKNKDNNNIKTCLKLGLTDLLEDLDVEDDDTIVVTLVPDCGKGLIKIKSIEIVFED
ncbi:unnamed protein product [Vicia faba]|uniref:Tyrosinase copper-binding domain-containing protein n=1 Tax=Vicia faba TaxID=3906 RepID=A0AAV0Z3C4_VICFA|nr:unnamed protein product [Vicia faba]